MTLSVLALGIRLTCIACSSPDSSGGSADTTGSSAVGLSSSSAYSTSACEKDMDSADQAEVSNACAVEYNATKGTPGC